MSICSSCKSISGSYKLICSSYNKMVDVNAVFIRKYTRDTHLPGSINSELQQVNHCTETMKQNYHRQGQEIIYSLEYCVTIGEWGRGGGGALSTITYDCMA